LHGRKRRILIQLQNCPFCRRARKVLDDAKISYEVHNINPDDRSMVEVLSKQPSVPILVEVIGMTGQDDDIEAYVKELSKKV
jgi:glutaredoxin